MITHINAHKTVSIFKVQLQFNYSALKVIQYVLWKIFEE